MSLYEEQLEAKIKRQKSEITRLLKENAELKSARAAGQEEAWKLAQKLVLYEVDKLEEIFETQYWTDVFLLSYSEVAANVAEWEQKKEEICVGDVVMLYEKLGLVTFVGKHVTVITEKGTTFVANKQDCTKTGRHIDVDAWLAQIGGESDE